MERIEVANRNGDLQLVVKDIPSPPARGCIIKTVYAGICHSDVHMLDMIIQGTMAVGCVLGHEVCGIIHSFGPEADAEKYGLVVGDVVMVYPWLGCDYCNTCNIGMGNLCDNVPSYNSGIGVGEKPGGYSSYVSIPRSQHVIKVPDGVPLPIATMLPCSGLTSFSAVSKIKPDIELALKKFNSARLLVIGAGGLGLWAIHLAKVMFGDKNVKIIVADVSEHHLEMAKAAGAEAVLWDPKDECKTTVNKTTNNGKANVDAVLDFVAGNSTLAAGIGSLNKGGSIVPVGLAGGSIKEPMPAMIVRSISNQTVLTGTASALKELVDLVAANDIKYPNLEFCKLAEVSDYIGKLRKGEVNGRAIIDFNK